MKKVRIVANFILVALCLAIFPFGVFSANSINSSTISGTLTIDVLPEGYTQLEYIESTGTQYIDTGIKVNQNSSVEIYGNFTQKATTSIFGAQPHFVITSTNSGDNYRFRYNNVSFDSTILTTTLSTVSLKQNNVIVDNNTLHNFSTATFSSTNNAFLFGRSAADGTPEELSSIRMYYAKIYDGDTLIRCYVACKNASDEIGMYDTVGRTFYGNSGTGTFTAGPVVS